MEKKTINFINKLIEKSTEAFIMGLEIYNKPTIKYRVEGFSFFICNDSLIIHIRKWFYL